MTYSALYNHCQSLDIPISRKKLTPKVLEITGAKVQAARIDADDQFFRGCFLAIGSGHQLVSQLGANVIALRRGMNPCWERLVFIKELMHLFDSDDEKTYSAESFQENLEFLTMPGSNNCAQGKSEVMAVWRALAVLCPEAQRQKFLTERNKAHIDDYGIAFKLKIPQKYVPYLFSKQFEAFLVHQELIAAPA